MQQTVFLWCVSLSQLPCWLPNFVDTIGTILLQAPGLGNLSHMMDIKLVNIGFGNIVSANRVIAIVSPESAPIKRIISDARERGQLVDATYGRRTRAVIITDSGHVVLSAIQPETVANRFVVSKEGGES